MVPSQFTVEYSVPFGYRILASAIDGLIIFSFCWLLGQLASLPIFAVPTMGWLECLVGILGPFWYYLKFEGFGLGTPGKRILGVSNLPASSGSVNYFSGTIFSMLTYSFMCFLLMTGLACLLSLLSPVLQNTYIRESHDLGVLMAWLLSCMPLTRHKNLPKQTILDIISHKISVRTCALRLTNRDLDEMEAQRRTFIAVLIVGLLVTALHFWVHLFELIGLSSVVFFLSLALLRSLPRRRNAITKITKGTVEPS